LAEDEAKFNVDDESARKPKGAARAIFTPKAGHSGRAIACGQPARLETDDFHFRPKSLLAKVSGYASAPVNAAAVRVLTATVDKRF
jgi:hypothetical protein